MAIRDLFSQNKLEKDFNPFYHLAKRVADDEDETPNVFQKIAGKYRDLVETPEEKRPLNKLFVKAGQKLQSVPDFKMPEVRKASDEMQPGIAKELFRAQEDKLALGKKITDFTTGLFTSDIRSKGETTEKIGKGEKLGFWDYMNILDVVGITGIGDIAAKKVFKEGAEETVERVTHPLAKKLMKAIEDAKPLRELQEVIYHEERGQKLAKFLGVGKRTGGEKGFFAELGSLKGELTKVNFESVRKIFKKGEVDSLYDFVKNSDQLKPWETINARVGLTKLIGQEGGAVPTENELELLSRVFGQEFVDTVLKKRTKLEKLSSFISEAVNFPKALRASIDLSAPFRQGWVMLGRPKQFVEAFGNMFKYAADEKAFKSLLDDIAERPTFEVMKKSGLDITDAARSLSRREESFMSNWAEKLPLLGRFVRASDRGFTGFLNKLRADVFDDLYEKGVSLGKNKRGAWTKDLAEWVNSATGRGKIPFGGEKVAVELNNLLFSPRLIASRINILNPVKYIKADPFVRKEALKTLFYAASMTGTAVGLAKWGIPGAEIETNPNNSDFGKIKIGDTRIDMWGGFQQYVRLASQLLTNQYVSSTTGIEYTLGEGYRPLTRLGIAERFVKGKLSPAASFIVGMMEGKTFTGEEFDFSDQLLEQFTPLFISDLVDLTKDEGMKKIGFGIPALFGAGVQTFAPTPEEVVRQVNSVKDHAKQLVEEGKPDEALNLLRENREKFTQSKALEKPVEMLKELRKQRAKIENNAAISREQKKRLLEKLDTQIEQLESFSERAFKNLRNPPTQP